MVVPSLRSRRWTVVRPARSCQLVSVWRPKGRCAWVVVRLRVLSGGAWVHHLQLVGRESERGGRRVPVVDAVRSLAPVRHVLWRG